MNTNNLRLNLSHLATFILLAPTTTAQQWSTNNLPPGLIAWWQAEGNLLDSAGIHHGSGSTAPTYGPGRFGQAFQFNGTDQSVSIPDIHPDLDSWTQFTLEAWFNTDTIADGLGGRAVFSKVGNASDPVNYNQGYQFGWYNNATRIVLQFNTSGQPWPGLATTASLDAPLLTHNWYHLVGTYDHNTVKIYLNGLLLTNNVVGPATLQNSGSSLRLSKDDNLNVPFAGRIDDARIYNRALTANEVIYLYEGPFPSGLAACWSGECDANDTLGSNHGTVGAGVGYTKGKRGQAFQFINGANSTIQFPNSATFQPTNNEFTIAAWVKPDFSSPNQIDTIIEKRDGCSSSYSFIFSVLKALPGYSPGVFGLGMLPQIGYIASTNRIPNDGQFHHVAVTYNGNKAVGNCVL